MPQVGPYAGDQRVVFTVSNALDFIDGRKLGKRRVVRPQLILVGSNCRWPQKRGRWLVDIADHEQAATQIPDVPDLKDAGIAELVLNVQAENLAVGILEILTNRKETVRRRRQRRISEDWLIRNDGVIRARYREDRRDTARIREDTGRTAIGRPIIREGLQQRAIEIDPVVTSHCPFRSGRISEAETRREVCI